MPMKQFLLSTCLVVMTQAMAQDAHGDISKCPFHQAAADSIEASHDAIGSVGVLLLCYHRFGENIESGCVGISLRFHIHSCSHTSIISGALMD